MSQPVDGDGRVAPEPPPFMPEILDVMQSMIHYTPVYRPAEDGEEGDEVLAGMILHFTPIAQMPTGQIVPTGRRVQIRFSDPQAWANFKADVAHDGRQKPAGPRIDIAHQLPPDGDSRIRRP